LKNRIKNHKEKIEKIEKIEKLSKKGEELNKDQKEQIKKKDEISIRLSESELIMDTLSSKLDDKAIKTDKKPSVEEKKREEVIVKEIEKVEVEIVKEVTNVDLAVLCCMLKVVNWDKCDTVKPKLPENGVTAYDKINDLKEASLKPANISVLCGEISESGHYKGVKTAELLRQVTVLLTLDFEAVQESMKPKQVEQPKQTAVKPVAAVVEKVKQVETKPEEKDDFDDDDEFVEVKTKKTRR